MFYSFLIALSYNIIYQRKHNLYQVDGAELDALRKCQMDCAVKHIPSVTNVANLNANGMTQCSLQSACAKCMEVGIFIIFYRRVHIKIASSCNVSSLVNSDANEERIRIPLIQFAIFI